jgi:hypothetical protein
MRTLPSAAAAAKNYVHKKITLITFMMLVIHKNSFFTDSSSGKILSN